MTLEKHAVTLLLTAGILLLGIGQYAYWSDPHESNSKSASLDGEHITQPDFVIKDVKSKPFSGGKTGQRMMRVLLANRLDHPVTILGATSGCRPWGCYEAMNCQRK